MGAVRRGAEILYRRKLGPRGGERTHRSRWIRLEQRALARQQIACVPRGMGGECDVASSPDVRTRAPSSNCQRTFMPARWVHEHRFPDSTALAHALAGEIRVDLDEALAAR